MESKALSDRLGFLTSENTRLKERLVSKSDVNTELAMQLSQARSQCGSLREEIVTLRSQNSQMLGGYRNLIARMKVRQERLMEIEQQYQRARVFAEMEVTNISIMLV